MKRRIEARGLCGLFCLLLAAASPANASSGPTDAWGFQASAWDLGDRPWALPSEFSMVAPNALSDDFGVAFRTTPSGAEVGRLDGPVLALSLVLLAAATATLTLAVDPPRNARWTRTNGFDRGVRSELGGSSRGTRDAADLASDVLLGAMGGALVADWVWQREEYGFWESAGHDGLFLLGSLTTSRALKLSVGRERPLVDPCDRRESFANGCDGLGSNRNASFDSGHASISGTMAGLLCARHLAHPERGAREWLVCGTAAAGSLATGSLRVTAFRHWGTDILVGWASGVAFGYWMPSWLRYRGDRGTDLIIAPAVSPNFVGMRLGVRF